MAEGNANEAGRPLLAVAVAPGEARRWLGTLRYGFGIEAGVGVSVGRFLRESLGLSAEYVECAVRTVFLNGHPVDDIERSVVRDGDEVALSAAMPGAVGICMRRMSPYAALRAGITHHEEGRGEAGPGEKGLVTLRLFNFILEDLGVRFLEQGASVPSGPLAAFLSTGVPGEATLEGEPVSMAEAVARIGRVSMVILAVRETVGAGSY